MTADSEPIVNVRKIAHTIQISNEMAMDCGLIPDTREHQPIPWRLRLRWRWQEWRYETRMRLASWIAGFDVESA